MKKKAVQYCFSSYLRGDLSGGTLDIWPLYLMHPESPTVQLSLELKSKCLITPLSSSKIILKSKNIDKTFSSQKNLLKSQDKSITLIQSFVRYFTPPSGFHLSACSDSPKGSGLGGSSALAVLLLKCFSKWLGKKFNFLESLYLCRDLEAQSLKTLTGLQDYIIPLQTAKDELSKTKQSAKVSKKDKNSPENIFENQVLYQKPFINIIFWDPLFPRIKTFKLPQKVRKNLLLIDSKIPHHSGQSNWACVKASLEGSDFVNQCRKISSKMAQAVIKGQFKKWPDLFEEEYQLRKKFHPKYIHPKTLKIIRPLKSEGVLAFKIMGAGSGGSLLLWTKNKTQTLKACKMNNIKLLEGWG